MNINNMTRLCVLRHAESEEKLYERLEKEIGVDEFPSYFNTHNYLIPLTLRGREQAIQIGRAIAQLDFKFDIVYASPFERTRETIKYVEEGLGRKLKVSFHQDLIERNAGGFTGRSKKQKRDLFPKYVDLKNRISRFLFIPPNGESLQQMIEYRINPFIQNIVSSKKTVLFVTHSSWIQGIRILLDPLSKKLGSKQFTDWIKKSGNKPALGSFSEFYIKPNGGEILAEKVIWNQIFWK